MQEKQLAQLATAIAEYDFPLVAYDFKHGTERNDFRSYFDLEEFIRSQLVSKMAVNVKDGLSNVIYWGYATSRGRQRDRVQRFRSEVTDQHLLKFAQLVYIDDIQLRDLARCNLPQFSKVSFISKVLMFLDPEKYVTLDLQLSKIKDANITTSFRNLVTRPTYIPVNGQNEIFYSSWCRTCCLAAQVFFAENGTRGVDVERGFFSLVRNGQVETAASILNRLEA